MDLECVFARFGSPWEKQKLALCIGRLQKSAFQDVAFQHRLETSLGEISKAKLGLSWRQVGLYKGSNWHVKATLKLSCFLSNKFNLGPLRGEVDGMGEAPSGDMGKLHCGIKNAIFPLFFF